VGYTVLSRFV